MKSEVLYIRVNKNCNAKCFMCDFWKNPKTEISKKQFDNILSQFENVKMVRFTGGEPLLCDELPEFVKICHERGIKTSIITNGLLLKSKLNSLVENGLDHIVISVDGPSSEIHDGIRGINGLFNIIEESLRLINSKYPELHTRINTVVSHNNISYLSQLTKWVEKHHIEQWSIIPIKLNDYSWKKRISLDKFKYYYDEFQSTLKGCNVKLLGYSGEWAGNVDDYWNGKNTVHPKGNCNLVKIMSFYDPFSNHIYPCNCVPHRSREFENPQAERIWYFENGYMYCKGCEPLNAFCSDFPESINDDIFEV